MNTESNLRQSAGSSVSTRRIRSRGRIFHSNNGPYFYTTNRWRKRSTQLRKNFSRNAETESTSLLTSTFFQKSEFFTAPESCSNENVQSIPIVNPLQYTGWQLYFPNEIFKESSSLVVKMKAFEKHIINNPIIYVLQHIRKQQWFYVSGDFLMNDSEFQASWVNFLPQLQETPNFVLSCLGLAMHHVVEMSIEKQSQQSNSSTDQYHRKNYIRRLHARPVNFFTVGTFAAIARENYDRLFVVQGLVEYITGGETKCTWVAYKCKRCGYEQAIRQGDYYPTKPFRCQIQCKAKRNFKEIRSSPYTKMDSVQMIHLRETGLHSDLESPNRIDIELRQDLVGLVCSGTEVTVMGVLKRKCLDTTRNQELQNKTTNNNYIQALSIVKKSNSSNKTCHKPTQKDLEVVQMISKEPNCFRLLVQSLAPEVCGHELAKAAILLSLFGGSGSQLHEEGEIHVLIVADPGVGKSNLVENAASISGKGKLLLGKRHASVMPTIQQMKPPTGSFIDTGALLASHGGHCCIDDMDKLSNQENLIHVMQAKSVTVRCSSAGFTMALQTSVLAGVNSASGHYDCLKLLRENIRLNPSLISLFHLTFVLTDKADEDRDSLLTEHVKALHSGMKKVLSIPPKYIIKLKANDNFSKNDGIELDERLKFECDKGLDLLPKILLKKYIAYARETVKPLLTKEAAEKIKDFYLGLRSEKNEENRFLITTRLLQGIIRLTQARARIDLSSIATKQHTRDVVELFHYSYTNTSVVDRFNSTLNGSIAGTSHGNQVKKFIQMLQLQSNALGRKVFEYEELKDMASHAGIRCGVTNLVELVNMQGYLLKKGPNSYEVRTQ